MADTLHPGVKIVYLLFNMVNKIHNNDTLLSLASFGLSKTEQEVYIHLLQRGRLTPLVLSRELDINRTTLYRILDSLSQKGLVSETLEHKSRRYEANNPSNLSLIVTQKQVELDTIKSELPTITQRLSHITAASDPSTRVLYFKGRSGLRQLLYNTLQAATEVVGYGYGNWNNGVGKQFAEKVRREYVDRHIRSREILNHSDRTGWYTNVPGYFNNIYTHRAISKTILPITHDTYIYNDVFSFYHMVRGELFGVEIRNASIADTQRHIFDILWRLSKPI